MPALLIVDHLPQHFSNEELAALFQPLATVRSARIVRDSRGHSLAFGFVEVDSQEQASEAVMKVNGSEVGGHYIRVAVVGDSSFTPK
jgi:RNA recognition motif-containing protein